MTVPAVDEAALPEKVIIGVLGEPLARFKFPQLISPQLSKALSSSISTTSNVPTFTIAHTLIPLSLRTNAHSLIPIPVRSLSELQQCDALIIPGGESTVISLVASNTPGLLPALKAFVQDPQKPVWGTCAGMILMAEEDGIGGGKVIKGREAKGWGGVQGLKVWRNLYGAQLESFEQPLHIPTLSNPSKPFNAIFIRAPGVHSLPSCSSSSSSASPKAAAAEASSPIPSPGPSPNSSSDISSSPSPSEPPSNPTLTSPPSSHPIHIETLATLPADRTAPAPPSDSPLGPPNPADLGKVMLRHGKKMITSFHPELSGDVRVHEYWVENCVLGQRGRVG